MFLKLMNRLTRTSALTFACSTMIFAPVAQGREAEAISEKQIQTYLHEFGVDQKTTVGEFWEKTKSYYPGYVYKDLEKFVQENKNLQMPTMTLTNAKATDGTVIPVLNMVSGNKTSSVQFYGQKNKWAKFNNVVLSEADIQSVSDMFKRIEASDIRLKNEADKYLGRKSSMTTAPKANSAINKQTETVIKDFARFNGFPRMTPVQWKQMTPMQRAGFIVNMRLLWKDARTVLRIDEAVNLRSKKGAKKFSSFEEFSRMLLGDAAEAAAGRQQNKIPAAGVDQSVSPAIAPAAANPDPTLFDRREREGILLTFDKAPATKSCIVLGYVSTEGRGTNYSGTSDKTCSDENIFKSEKYTSGSPLAVMVQEAQAQCQLKGSNFSACNPAIYSYEDNGKAICVDRNVRFPSNPPPGNYQKATWWEGPCDSKMKLTTDEVQNSMKTTDTAYADGESRFDATGKLKDWVKKNQIDSVEIDQSKTAYAATRRFLDNALAHKNAGTTIEDLLKGNKPWSKEMDNMLVDIQEQFEKEINEGIQSCEKSITRQDNIDKNQKGACDQLHKRWLFTERFLSEYRANSCPTGSKYIYELIQKVDSRFQYENAEANKKKVTGDERLCQCTADPSKATKLGARPSECVGVPTKPAAECPTGMANAEGGVCSCPGSDEKIPVATAQKLAAYKDDKMCAKSCDKPEGITNFEYDKCECKDGMKLEDENEPGFISKIVNHDQPRQGPSYVCKESHLAAWILGGTALVGLAAFFFRNKTKNQPAPITPPSPPLCGNHCPSGTQMNTTPGVCRCDPVPPPTKCIVPKVDLGAGCVCPVSEPCAFGQKRYNSVSCQCDLPQPATCANGSPAPNNNALSCKCSDGSMITSPSPLRPGGCPSTSEGGSGNNPNNPGSGGVK